MNDRHPSGPHYPAGTADDVGHPAYASPGFDGGWAPGYDGHTLGSDPFGGAWGDPPYGHPGSAPYGQDPYGQAAAYGDGRHERTAWDSTPAHGIPRYDANHASAAYAGYGAASGYGGPPGGGYGGTPPPPQATGGYPANDGYADAGWDTSHGDPSHGDSHGWDSAGWDTGGWDTSAARAGGWQADAWSPDRADVSGHASGHWETAGGIGGGIGGGDAAPAHAYATAGGWGTPGLAEWETTTAGWPPGGHGGTGHVPAEPAWQERHFTTPGAAAPGAAAPDADAYPGWQREAGWHDTAGASHSHTAPLPVVDEHSGELAEEFAGAPGHDSERAHHAERAHDAGTNAPEPDPDVDAPAGYRGGFTPDHGGLRFAAPAGHGPDDATPVPPRRNRRSKPKRSALLTVAAPSLCVLGVTAVAASAITKPGTDEPAQSEEDLPLAADEASGEATPVDANQEFDTQLESLTAAADDYADRASRTQGRMDLEEREAEEQRLAEEEAARKEAERPKHALPVEQRGLSMRYNQPGLQYVGLHTGIDFPVSEGTPVRAATDGTVRTLLNPSYGNLAIVTAPDGTETWYAHLSSTVVQAGEVQAGDVIAYSGNTGNSLGPHLHFEVRPAGGSHVDPAAWLRARGLEPEY